VRGVATKEAAPFAFRGPDGEWTGISIELWSQLADELDLSYRLEEATLEGMVEGTAGGAYDAAMAALTITADREATVDFTYPFY
jgi:polar amino acid transport system substrate-binding protein